MDGEALQTAAHGHGGKGGGDGFETRSESLTKLFAVSEFQVLGVQVFLPCCVFQGLSLWALKKEAHFF